MHKSKKIVLFAIVGLLLATGANAQTVTNSAYWQQFYQSVYSKIISKTTVKPIPTPTPTPTPTSTVAPKPTPTPTPAPTTPAPAPAPAPAPVQTPSSSGKLWGAYLSDGNVSSFESSVGKPMDMQAVFYAWGDSFPSNSDKTKTLVIYWEPNGISLNNIINGSQDSTIQQFVSQAKSYGGPVVLIPGEEINGNWDSWDGAYGSNTPAQVVSAFKHIHDVVAKVGASNVKMGWDVNNDSVPDTSANAIANYWPGSAYVDYICLDGFNFGSPWQSYSDVFSSALSQLKGYGKPIIIASVASAESSQKATWITDALNQMYSDSSITGFIWFNENKEQNWLVNSDSASLQAFKSAIQQY
jgi:hypothetical protein